MAFVNTEQNLGDQLTKDQTQVYDFYGTKYKADSLRKIARDGFATAMGQLKDGDKYLNQRREILEKILSGIADGTIVYDKDTNEFVDSRQGLRNSNDKNRNKDHVGIVANYLYGIMDQSEKYEEPSDKYKIKFSGQDSIDKALMQALYHSDSEDLSSLIDRDDLDEKTKKRAITKRAEFLKEALLPFTTREGWQSKFTNFTDEDFNHYSPYFIKAYDGIKDGSIDAGDMAAFSMLSRKPSWQRMFHTGEGYGQVNPLEQQQAVQQDEASVTPSNAIEQQRQEVQTNFDAFEAWMRKRYPKSKKNPSLKASLESDKKYGDWTDKTLQGALTSMSSNELIKLLKAYFVSSDWKLGNYAKIQNYFSSRGKAIDGDTFDKKYSMSSILRALQTKNDAIYSISDQFKEAYHIPGLDKNGIGYVWDSIHNTLREVRLHSLPYWQDKIIQEFINEQQTGLSPTDREYSEFIKYFSAKNGGVLKAFSGLKVPVPTLLEAISYTDEDLTDDKRLLSVYDTKSKTFTYEARNDRAATDKVNPGNGGYDYQAGGEELEKTQLYKKWLEILGSNEKVAEAWARRYRALQKLYPNYYKGWFNKDDSFNFENFKKSTIYKDQKLDLGHDFYRGRVYQMLDENGKPTEGYYTDLLDGYEIVGDPELDKETGLAWIYKMKKGPSKGKPDLEPRLTTAIDLTGPLGTKPKDNPGKMKIKEPDQSRFTGTEGDGKRKKFDLGKIKADPRLTDILEWGIRTAGNAANEKLLLRDHIYYDPQNRQSPEYWDWFTNKTGKAKVGEMLWNMSKANTSDADKVINTMLDTYKIANREIDKTAQADHAMGIKSLEKQIENNNFSQDSRAQTASLNKRTNWEIDNYNKSVKATKNVTEVESLAQLLQKFGSENKAKDLEEQEKRKSAIIDALQADYLNAVNQAQSKYKAAHPDATDYDMVADQKFNNLANALQKQYKYNIYNADFNSNENPYADFVSQPYGQIIGSTIFSRKGGVLIPKSKRF